MLQGCGGDDSSPIPNRLSLRFNVSGMSSEIGGSNQDTIKIEEVKFLVDKFQLFSVQQDTLESQVDALVMKYDERNLGADEVVIEGALGVVDIKRFNGIKLFIDQVKTQDNIVDQEFRTGGEQFSFILKGEFNGMNFTHFSKVKFDKLFNFETVEVSPETETILVRVLSEVNSFMIDRETQAVLNPDNDRDAAKIDSLLEVSLNVEAEAATSLPF